MSSIIFYFHRFCFYTLYMPRPLMSHGLRKMADTPPDIKEVQQIEKDMELGLIGKSVDGFSVCEKGWLNAQPMAFGKLGGRKRITYKDLEKNIMQYIDNAAKSGKFVSINGLCVFLGINHETFRALLNESPNKTRFFAKLKHLQGFQRELLTEGALTGKFKERTALFLLNVEHNLIEKKEQTINHAGHIDLSGAVKSIEKAREVIDVETVDDDTF